MTDDGKTVKPEVKVGDKVLYGKYSGTEVTIEGEEYLIMRMVHDQEVGPYIPFISFS